MKSRPISVLKRLKQLEIGEVGLSSITVSELYYGVSKSQYPIKNQQFLEKFLMPFDVLPFDEKSAQIFGEIRSDLERRGCVIGLMDMLIASHALSQNCILVSNNTKEFERIPNLKLENWV